LIRMNRMIAGFDNTQRPRRLGVSHFERGHKMDTVKNDS
jgi:hypothetical protein